MKKVLAVLLAAVLAAATLMGCSPKKNDTTETVSPTEAVNNPDEEPAAPTDTPEGWTGEVEPVVMAWMTGGTDNPYMDKVAETINAYTRDKIGVEISFRQVSIFDSASQYTMWIGGGEAFDLMPIAFVPVTPFIQMNMIQPLDEYLDNAPTIQKLAADGYPMYDPNNTGQVYGINVTGRPAVGTVGALYVYTDALEATGLGYKDGQVVTMDDIDKVAKAIKEKFPNAYAGVYGSMPRSDLSFINDPLGASLTSGVIVGLDSTEIVNYFETDGYKKYIEVMRDWYNKGLILKDAATTDVTQAGSMTTDPDNCLMMWNSGDLGLVRNYEAQTGKEISCLYLSVKYSKAISNVGGFMSIPVTSEHPEAAMRFLDLLYSDSYVYNTLMYGIEGENYEFINEERTAVQPKEEAKYVAIGVYGNQKLLWTAGEPDPELDAQYDAWENEGLSNKTKGVGFFYDATNMTNQITALDAVLSEYRAALETGSVDPDKVYPEFMEKLKRNGIDEVIADKQAQFDDWLKNN